MGNIVTVEATALLQSSVAGSAYTAPSPPIKLALITTTTPSTATAAGSEVSNSGGSTYARATIAFNSATGGSITNSGSISFTNMPACTVGGIELWDSAGTPVRRWFGLLSTSKTLGAGDTISFAASAISVSLA